ncbi:MAG: ADP-ribosylglycohydrolase family protein [Methanomicrobiaceae archaeon]|nr:ADP-ribosylglycohydrolase family protein [Methanomicrobiaceae archaeon]
MDLSRAQRMMLGIAIGDALGREYESIPGKKIHIDAVPEEYAKGTGVYTDDTQMSIAVAETMLSGESFEAEILAGRFVEAYRRDPREGYSVETLSMLENSRTGEEFIAWIGVEEKTKRKSDGSAMRAVPIGLFPDSGDVITNAIINSEISHTHTYAVSASVGIALASHYFYYNLGLRSCVIEYILQHMEQIWAKICGYLRAVDALEEFDPETILGEYADFGPPYTDAKPVLGTVLYILKMNASDPLQAIKKTLSLGGDTDTTLCIILGIIMADHPVAVLPEKLLTNLENGDYGRDYILELGKKLEQKYPAE